MSFENVFGQDHITKTFKEIIANNCLAHAYIFLGIEGIGKSFFAKQLAKNLNCKNVDAAPCGSCSSCYKIETGSSPDIHWISLDEEKKFIGIDQIKNLQLFSTLKPVESNYKIFIIDDADKLNEDASNCILKTLEEPPPSTLIIALVNSLDYLPETVISRCQIMRFANLPGDAIKTILRQNHDIDNKIMEWVVQVSNGSPGCAIKLLEEDLYSKNEILINALSNLQVIDNFDLSKIIIEWVMVKEKSSEEKRTYLKYILNLILYYYRDRLIYNTQITNYPHYFNKSDNIINNQCRIISTETISKVIDQILVAFNHLESNANINLLVENLITGIAFTLSEDSNCV